MSEQLPAPEPGMVVRFDYQWARSVRDRLVEELKNQRLKMENVRYLPPRTRS
ncbi:ABC-type branched-subunit amino acid transport system substrate-binding protein [Bradyrhizobium sp. cir1]|uniref:hypothetical protein n=1 Tax=Bradyrhizobium sp. cir1 TaxID=1445730 RepID=UPI0016061984|nr:hypothetical protein [Bradyrhizobium sp. cir1]MBB4372450.1 ABC-type branched-subunit amino acid transport system substrate-binding protein [Bradyrhizobium sp. cir1]